MSKTKDFDIRELPSWEYFAWGILNGIFLGILILHKIDISETGLLSEIFKIIKPFWIDAGLSIVTFNLIIFFLGFVGLVSLIWEISIIWEKGWPTRIMASSGFLSLFLIILGFDLAGIILFFIGGFTVVKFPDE